MVIIYNFNTTHPCHPYKYIYVYVYAMNHKHKIIIIVLKQLSNSAYI